MILQAIKVSAGVDRTQHSDYFAELGDPDVKEIVPEIAAPGTGHASLTAFSEVTVTVRAPTMQHTVGHTHAPKTRRS